MDFMKRIFLNKTLLIFLASFVLFFFCLNDSVSAVSSDSNNFEFDDVLYNRAVEISGDRKFIAQYSNTFKVWTFSDFDANTKFYINGNYLVPNKELHFTQYMFNNPSDLSNYTTSEHTFPISNQYQILLGHTQFFCNFTVFNNDSYSTDDVFFQLTPTVEILPLQTAEEIPTAMGGVLKILIPVGLVGCGIFLLVLLTRSVLWRLL